MEDGVCVKLNQQGESLSCFFGFVCVSVCVCVCVGVWVGGWMGDLGSTLTCCRISFEERQSSRETDR